MYDHGVHTQRIRSHGYSTRRGGELVPGFARLTLTENSMLVAGPNVWSSIPDDIKNSPSRNSFKFEYKRFLLSSYNQNQTN